jgi:hypothetical protein
MGNDFPVADTLKSTTGQVRDLLPDQWWKARQARGANAHEPAPRTLEVASLAIRC